MNSRRLIGFVFGAAARGSFLMNETDYVCFGAQGRLAAGMSSVPWDVDFQQTCPLFVHLGVARSARRSENQPIWTSSFLT
jgi:hypothetical protein